MGSNIAEPVSSTPLAPYTEPRPCSAIDTLRMCWPVHDRVTGEPPATEAGLALSITVGVATTSTVFDSLTAPPRLARAVRV